MYVKAPIPSEVYHLTKKANLESILDDGAIRRFDDTECWFCESLAKMKAYMEQTVLCEGKPYYGVGGQLCRYPKFEPDEHIILKPDTVPPRRKLVPLESGDPTEQPSGAGAGRSGVFQAEDRFPRGSAVPKRGGNRCR